MRIIQVRPSRNPRWQKQGGWVAFEAEGVSPVFCGEHGRADALSYAKQRARRRGVLMAVLSVKNLRAVHEERLRRLLGVCPLGGYRLAPRKRIIFMWPHSQFLTYAVAGNVITSACFVATGAKVTRCACAMLCSRRKWP
jgi:hypothetical protein